MKVNTKTAQLTLLAIMTITLSACSDQPSTSDVQDSFSDRNGLAGCDIFKTKFEKINGIQKDERHYVMEMKGEIVMKPLKKNLAYVNDLESYLKDNKDAFEKAKMEMQNSSELDALRQEKDGKLIAEYSLRQLAIKTASVWKPEFIKNIKQECQNLDPSITTAFFSSYFNLDPFKESMTYSFQKSFPMIKTDNGWKIGM